MSMISEQIEELRLMAEMFVNGEPYGNLLRRAADTIEMLSEKVREPKRGEWIPCSERLPSDDNDYLVVDGDGEMAVGYYRDDADAWDNSCFGWLERDDEDEHPTRLGKVVAWMPLPKLYGEREGE